MASLNQLAAKIANAIKQPYNHELKERVKDSYRSKTAERLRQSFDKYGIDDEVKIAFKATLIPIEKSTNCNLHADCGLFVTENPIPDMVRYKGDVPFTFVGDKDGTVYTYVKYWERKFRKYYPVVANSPIYMLHNKHIITNNNKDSIILENIFLGIGAIINCTDSCADDSEFPIPLDMEESITYELIQFYGNTRSDDSTIKTTDNEKVR